MSLAALSLAVVGADYPNKGKMPGRRFEIALCAPGDPVELRPEPENPADEHAIAVYSERGVQMGYIPSQRAPWMGKILRMGHEVTAIFQEQTHFGAVIRVAFDGEVPVLPEAPPARPPEPDFYPDEIYDDD